MVQQEQKPKKRCAGLLEAYRLAATSVHKGECCMLTSLPSEEKLGKALLPVPFLVSFSTSALPQSSDPAEPSAIQRKSG
jgi:hypothetical protein